MAYTAAIMGLTNAALAALIAFGISLSETQTAAVVGLVNAALILGDLLLQSRSRSATSPPAAPLP